MFRVKCRELSLISGASSYSHAYLWVFCDPRLLQDSTFGWQTLTSENADHLCSQNPRARMTSLVLC